MDDARCRNTKPSRIPDFKSVEEETEFWDRHDSTDFLDALRPVRVRFSPNFSIGKNLPPDFAD